MTTIEAIQNNEDITWRRRYEYRCVFCKKKRASTKRAVAKRRVCNACARARLETKQHERQYKLFPNI